MPPTQSQDQRRFDQALKTYLAALEASRGALGTAIHHPSRQTEKAYWEAFEGEKKARKEYRKASRKLRSRMEKR
jgi:hypothetical protein